MTMGGSPPCRLKSRRHGTYEEHQKLFQEKAEKLLHYFGRITMIEITVDLQDIAHVEVRVDAEYKHDFVAWVRHDDLLTAFEEAIDRISIRSTDTKRKYRITSAIRRTITTMSDVLA
jgi:putative sigma-54 modulation protein